MDKKNQFFEDFTKLAGSAMDNAFASLHDMKQMMEEHTQTTVEHMLKKMNVVAREEFEVVKDMAVKAREENDALKARLDALESKKAPKKKS